MIYNGDDIRGSNVKLLSYEGFTLWLDMVIPEKPK